MNYSKKIAFRALVLLFILVSSGKLYAQQDPMYTQYMENLLVINPGFAGSKEMGNALLVARNQWVSFKSAPSTRSFAYHSPVKGKSVGIGISILNDKIGPQKQTGLYIDYSYFLNVSETYKLGLGLKAGVSFYRANLTQLVTLNPDPVFDNDIYENFLPNFGIGFYLYSDDIYFGLSAPKLIENKITRTDVASGYVSVQQIHMYAIAGKKFDLNEDFQMKTYSMLKYVKGAPMSFDLTALAGLKERVWLGGMFRLGSSYGFLIQFKPTSKMLIGYSYDLSVSELNAYNNGSHEILFSYDIDVF